MQANGKVGVVARGYFPLVHHRNRVGDNAKRAGLRFGRSIMRNPFRFMLAAVLFTTLFLVGACRNGADSQTEAANKEPSRSLWDRLKHPTERKLVVAAGTEFSVRLEETLSSASSHNGDSFAGTLDQPLVVDGIEAIPQGARVAGRVVAARASGHLETPPELAVTLTSLEGDGKTYNVVTTDYGLAGRSHKKRNSAWIGGGAAGGALLGALLGGKKGAAVGAVAGAGGGTATAYATGKKDIVLPAESVLRFSLREPLTVVKAS